LLMRMTLSKRPLRPSSNTLTTPSIHLLNIGSDQGPVRQPLTNEITHIAESPRLMTRGGRRPRAVFNCLPPSALCVAAAGMIRRRSTTRNDPGWHSVIESGFLTGLRPAYR
jgi:hypothetical protein